MDKTHEILKHYWGYDSLRPLQAEAIGTVLAKRDSVVVLPTGGGKSLCFQIPALQLPGMAVVISPLISLMKDQVDSLIDCGVPAACVNSTTSNLEKQRIAADARSGELKLLYLSPERLMTDRMISFLQSINLSFIAVDEAHCISDWGHDFRPEYRMLGQLRQQFPNASLHGYTATATPRVREDIARELHLNGPEILVGSFDRPNLVYRVKRRSDRMEQIIEVIERKKDESGIIYCIRRLDVDEICLQLKREGYSVAPYHAGLSEQERTRNQEAFLKDRVKIIVATVAFGMGIDKSDVRYVIHAGAPKSLEHYQQESGRGGRDGLESECWLFYSASDFQTWRKIQSDLPEDAYEIALTMLQGIEKFCNSSSCRHRSLVEYFGQDFPTENCQACDSCLTELTMMPEPLVLAQKILSSIVRQGENFGAEYTSSVLLGKGEQRIVQNGHDRLSTYGILKGSDKKHVKDWIEQLVSQGFLERTGDYSVLAVTSTGKRLLKGELIPRLMQPKTETKESAADKISWDGVDRGLFDRLRTWRKERAEKRGVPPFAILNDATLRELARVRPSTMNHLQGIQGLGDKKSADYGNEVLSMIQQYCQESQIAMDVLTAKSPTTRTRSLTQVSGSQSSDTKRIAYERFAKGESAQTVSRITERALSTVWEYLRDFIQDNQIMEPAPWVSEGSFWLVRDAVKHVGKERLKPIFEHLDGAVPYEDIRISLACLANSPQTDVP